MAMVDELAAFVVAARFDQLSEAARLQAKIRLLDSLGCAYGALDSPLVSLVAAQTEDFGGNPHCTLIGGGRAAPDRAAFYNGTLVRFLDFNDSYLARGETCHPSDNLAPVLAACEYADGNGMDFLTALAVAYQVQCRLSDEAPVRDKGFDHTTQGAYAVAAGVAKALHLDQGKTANAIAIAGTAFNALRVTRTGTLSNWKGLAYPNTAFGATHAAFLAMRGVTGPSQVFEGNKGFMEAISGHFSLDWLSEDLEKITQTVLKRYNAEIHSQSTIEAALELMDEYQLTASEILRIEVETFDVAYHIIGGGEEGEKITVETKEEADHSLPYIIAVALLDGKVLPAQYMPDRIRRPDVQVLLRQVRVRPIPEFSRHFPAEMPSRVTLTLLDGRVLSKAKSDYQGFRTRPMVWDTVVSKFEQLSQYHLTPDQQNSIEESILNLEQVRIRDFTALLGKTNEIRRSGS
jgi:2-methylcitrate dehydratase